MKARILLACLFLPILLHAQDLYKLSGRVNVAAREGDIYIFLVNSETFKKNRFQGIDTLVFPIHQDKVFVEFAFENVPAGIYGISCYQDKNRDRRFNKLLFSPIEPWAFSFNNQIKFPPKFDDISFNLGYDLRINLILGK
jgi:uncharacterized protein (DUF2141 family)